MTWVAGVGSCLVVAAHARLAQVLRFRADLQSLRSVRAPGSSCLGLATSFGSLWCRPPAVGLTPAPSQGSPPPGECSRPLDPWPHFTPLGTTSRSRLRVDQACNWVFPASEKSCNARVLAFCEIVGVGLCCGILFLTLVE